MNILTTGLTGLVGSRIKEVLTDCQFEDFRGNRQSAIQNKENTLKRFQESKADYVLHLAAKADPDECEKDKEQDLAKLKNRKITEDNSINLNEINSSDWKDSNSAFAINVVGTKNTTEAAKTTGKKLIYISTDYIFSGKTRGIYTEESEPEPVNYYGLTKYWAEQVVREIYPEALIVRIAVPYGLGSALTKRIDVVNRIKERLEKGEIVNGIEDQSITPTFIDDIARSIKLLFEKNISGTVHVVGSSHLSPYEAALAIADVFHYDKHLIKPISMRSFYQNRAKRPQYTNLSNEKLKRLGVVPSTFIEGLEKINKQ